MANPDFSARDLRHESFVDADLPGSDSSGADVRGVDLSRARLADAVFSKARHGPPLSPRPNVSSGLDGAAPRLRWWLRSGWG